MINGKKILAIIPARGGSKGVPGKNIKLLNNRPLIDYTIKAAAASKYIDRTIVSTDAENIATVAKRCGADVPFMRPDELAGDETPGIDVIFHGIEACPGYDMVMILQPTSPFRTVEDIDAGVALFDRSQVKACVAVEPVKKHPAWCFSLDKGFLQPPESSTNIYQRQQFDAFYSLNGALYIADIDWLKQHRNFVSPQTLAYIMPAERSLDIDTQLDFRIADLLMNDMSATNQLSPEE
jgi:CMP-N,N'-diacetyllegionaminic acid synthase